MTLQSPPARLLVGALALVVALTILAPPAFAAPAQRPLSQAAAAKTAALPGAALAQTKPVPAAAPAAEAPGPKPFLKTTQGAVAIALLAGAIGYTAYSLGHDRVKSPIR